MIQYWIGFSLIPGIGRVRFNRLLTHFGDLEKAWYASDAELQAAGLDTRAIQSILFHRRSIDLDAEMAKIRQHNISVLTSDDPEYPLRLREIYDYPPLIYVRGKGNLDQEWSLAVVGTRRATAYGREVTRHLVLGLAQSGMTIVSGMARGIDTIAHQTALAAGANTIAVLACGLDQVYPPENRKLAEAIMAHGLLISEYPVGTKPRAEFFPRRNRIMSGLTLGTLVTEAAERSGALITARMALEQDREVFAVPGSILSAMSRGCNKLIREGAKAVLGIDDILEELNLSAIPRQLKMEEIFPANDAESVILRHLSEGPLHVDDLCRYSCLPVSLVSSTLTMLELKGMVNQLGNMNYVAVRGAKTN